MGPQTQKIDPIQQREKPSDCSVGSIITLKPHWKPVVLDANTTIHSICFEYENTTYRENNLTDVREPLDKTHLKDTVLYCNQPECNRNVLGETLSKTTTRAAFTCSERRRQHTKLGTVYWPCPGIKQTKERIRAEPIRVNYRCLGPNSKGCDCDITVAYNNVDRKWKPPTCSRCKNEWGNSVTMVQKVVYDQYQSRIKGLKIPKCSYHPSGTILYVACKDCKHTEKLTRERRTPTSRRYFHSDCPESTHWSKKGEYEVYGIQYPEGTKLRCKDCKELTVVRADSPPLLAHEKCKQAGKFKGVWEAVKPARRRLDALIARFQRESERCIAS